MLRRPQAQKVRVCRAALEEPPSGGDRKREGRCRGSHQSAAGPSAAHAACGGSDGRSLSAHRGMACAHAGAQGGGRAARRARRTEYSSRRMVPGAGDGGRIEVGRCRAPRRLPAWLARRHGRESGTATDRTPRSMHLDAQVTRPAAPPATRNGRVRPPLVAPPRSPQDDAGFSPNVLVVWRHCHCFVWLLPYLSYKRHLMGRNGVVCTPGLSRTPATSRQVAHINRRC